jgi:hypothetical protein
MAVLDPLPTSVTRADCNARSAVPYRMLAASILDSDPRPIGCHDLMWQPGRFEAISDVLATDPRKSTVEVCLHLLNC